MWISILTPRLFFFSGNAPQETKRHVKMALRKGRSYRCRFKHGTIYSVAVYIPLIPS